MHDPVFILLLSIVWLGFLSYSAAAAYACTVNYADSLLLEQWHRRNGSFRLTGRVATTASEVRAWRLALPLPAPCAPRHYLRRAPSVNEAVTVPNAVRPSEYV